MRISSFETHTSWVVPSKILTDAVSHPLLAPLYVTDIGLFGRAWHHYTERKSGCEQYILKYCVQGRGFVETQGRRRLITSNTVFVIPPGVSHVYGASDDDPWDVYWVHYTGSLAPHFSPGPNDDIYVADVPYNKMPQLVQLYQSMFSALARGFSQSNLIYVSLTMGHLLGAFFYSHAGSPAPGQQPIEVSGRHSLIVNQMILYMQDHITDNITLGELAQRASLSKSQLSLIFMEQTNYSPINFFINLKMQRACSYLELSDMTIQQVAANMGYKDPYYFSRLFAKTMGLSPSTYRALKKG